MSLNIQIIQAREFVRATPEGVLDFEQSKKLLIEIAAATTGLGNYAILLDIRRAISELSVTDLWYLTEQIAQLNEPYRRQTAVLATLEQFENTRFLALAAQNRGFKIQAFTSFEDAIEWLIA